LSSHTDVRLIAGKIKDAWYGERESIEMQPPKSSTPGHPRPAPSRAKKLAGGLPPHANRLTVLATRAAGFRSDEMAQISLWPKSHPRPAINGRFFQASAWRDRRRSPRPDSFSV